LKKTNNYKFNFCFLDQKLQFTYPLASIKDSQATGEAFSPQKRTSSNSKDENSVLFSIFWGNFCPPGSGSGSAICMRIRIRIQQLKLMRIHADPDPDMDPDPKPCVQQSLTHAVFFTKCLKVAKDQLASPLSHFYTSPLGTSASFKRSQLCGPTRLLSAVDIKTTGGQVSLS
jgi:hypothetical protein